MILITVPCWDSVLSFWSGSGCRLESPHCTLTGGCVLCVTVSRCVCDLRLSPDLSCRVTQFSCILWGLGRTCSGPAATGQRSASGTGCGSPLKLSAPALVFTHAGGTEPKLSVRGRLVGPDWGREYEYNQTTHATPRGASGNKTRGQGPALTVTKY